MANQCTKFLFGSDDTIYRRDGSAPIPADEPVFLLRGKDEVAVHAIARYIEVMESYPDNELAREHAASASERLGAILAFQAAHPGRVGMGCHTCKEETVRVRLSGLPELE